MFLCRQTLGKLFPPSAECFLQRWRKRSPSPSFSKGKVAFWCWLLLTLFAFKNSLPPRIHILVHLTWDPKREHRSWTQSSRRDTSHRTPFHTNVSFFITEKRFWQRNLPSFRNILWSTWAATPDSMAKMKWIRLVTREVVYLPEHKVTS